MPTPRELAAACVGFMVAVLIHKMAHARRAAISQRSSDDPRDMFIGPPPRKETSLYSPPPPSPLHVVMIREGTSERIPCSKGAACSQCYPIAEPNLGPC